MRYEDKTANPMYGKKHSRDTIERQRAQKIGEKNPMFGSTWTEVQRLRSGTRGKRLNLSHDQRKELKERAKHFGATTGLRPVRCVEDDAKFDSIQSAAKEYGVSKSTLCGHLRGLQKTCRGKHFEYMN